MSQAGPSEEYYARLAHTSRGPLRPPSPPSSPILPAQRTNQEELEHLASDSLYAVLNVDRNASPSELKERYRSLASIFHPDKQADDQARQAANARFQEIQRAYEILTDPSRRMIYDSFGEEGLRTTWDLGPKNLSPEEMKKLFQKQAAEFHRQEAEALVSSKGTSSISVDARTVFISKDKFVRPEDYQHDVISRLKRARPGQVVMTHSFEVPVNERTQVVVEGQAVSVKGRGGANIFGTIRHQFSPRLWMELRAGALEPRIITLDSTYTHDENTYMTVNAIWQTWLAPPTSTITLGRKLSLTATGFIRYKPGFYTLGPWGKAVPEEVQLSEPSSLAVGVTSAAKTGTGWTVETQAGIGNSHLAADWSTLLLGVRLRFGGHASTAQGVALFVDAGRKITEHVRGGIRLGVDIFGGITMRFRFSRLGQNINIPVKLTYDLNPYVLAGALALPAGTYCAVHYFYLETRQKDSLKRRLKALREENAELIAERKAKALDAVALMHRTASLNQATERDRNGLIILHADYGLETSFTDRGIKENEEEEDVIDVTIPIQALVSNSKLVIPGGRSKSNLIGFWDPCIGEKKKLRVRYLFRGKVHQVTAGDTAVLRAPLELHLLQ